MKLKLSLLTHQNKFHIQIQYKVYFQCGTGLFLSQNYSIIDRVCDKYTRSSSTTKSNLEFLVVFQNFYLFIYFTISCKTPEDVLRNASCETLI